MAKIPEEAKLQMLYDKEVDELTDEEVAKTLDFAAGIWNSMPVNMQIDPLATMSLPKSIIKLLIEKNVCTEEEADKMFAREHLRAVKDAIQGAKTEMARQRILQGIQGPRIIPPNGPIQN